MKITLRQKEIEGGNTSLYLDIYDKGKRKFEFLSLYLLPEEDEYTKARNEETLKRAHEIRAERILHPETIPETGHLAVVRDTPNDKTPTVLDWIQTCIDWMEGNPEYSASIVAQTRYLQERMKEFLSKKRRKQITLKQFDKEWFKAFFLWLKNDYVPQKYVRMETKPLSQSSLRNLQQRIVAVFNRAVKCGKLNANPFYQMLKSDTFAKGDKATKSFLTPMELKLFMASVEASPGVSEAQSAFVFACLTGLRISDIKALEWSNIKKTDNSYMLFIEQKKTKELIAVPIGTTAMEWLPKKGDDDKVFHLAAHANVDAAIKRIAKKVGIEKNVSFHTARHTFATLVQAVTRDIETTKKMLGHRSLKSTMVYAEVLTEEKVKAVENTKTVFHSRKPKVENKKIPQTKRTAATNRHPRKVTETTE
jgi:integrase